MTERSYGGQALYSDMLEQAVLAEKLGYYGVGLPEHHLINILLMPSPMLMAVKIASMTQRVKLISAISVLPLHDMRVFAGELIQTDILCDGRFKLGVGRGAFAYEMGRLGSPLEYSREKFDESLTVLLKLLNEEEVSYSGDYYNFDALTIMPRPERDIPIMIAALIPEAIYHSTLKGFNIQTTPLSGDANLLQQQVGAFHRAKNELGRSGEHLRLSLQRGIHVTKDEKEASEIIAKAHIYYSQFDNVFTGPGIVKNGMIEKIPRKQTVQELAKNLIVCPVNEAIDRLGEYAELGIDELFITANLGASNDQVKDGMCRLSEEVMPHFDKT